MDTGINELAAALAKAQSKIDEAVLDGKNPFFNNSRYATLTSVWKACRKHLTENGLAVVQGVEQGTDGKLFLETRLLHASGQSLSFMCPLIIGKQDMQGLGSAITYAKRYSLAALVGVADQEDDDGNAAAKAQNKEPPPPPPAKFKKFAEYPLSWQIPGGSHKGKEIGELSTLDLHKLCDELQNKDKPNAAITNTVKALKVAIKLRENEKGVEGNA